MKKLYRFRRSDTGEVIRVFDNGKKHAWAKALVAIGPNIQPGVQLTPIFRKKSKKATLELELLMFTNEIRREDRVRKLLHLPTPLHYV